MTETHILIVEDQKEIRELIKLSLRSENYTLFEASSGRRLFEILESCRLDLILLDIMLPDGNSLDLLPAIREHTVVPILILSGIKDESLKVKGLELGADDYIIKPFRPGELRARIQANLRRSREMKTPPAAPLKIKFGNWVLDRSSYEVYEHESQIKGHLTLHEFHLLETLVMAAKNILSREDLIRLARRRANDLCTARAIDIQVTRIRKKLGDNGPNPRLIKTVRGAGYMIDCETKVLS